MVLHLRLCAISCYWISLGLCSGKYFFLSPSSPPGELQHTLNLTKPLAIFCSPSCSRKILQVTSNLPHTREVVIFDHNEPIVEDKRIYSYKSVTDTGDAHNFEMPPGDFSEDVALILMSSGTTGLPKGVMLTHGNFFAQLEISRYVSSMWQIMS